jgi:hypothetical protein
MSKSALDPHALARLVAERDLDGLGRRLTDDVRLRALLPGGPIEEHGRDAVLKKFDEWFGEHAEMALEEARGELVGDRLLVHYRLGFDPSSNPRVLTQTWVSSIGDDGAIFRIDLLCSGFREVA